MYKVTNVLFSLIIFLPLTSTAQIPAVEADREYKEANSHHDRSYRQP